MYKDEVVITHIVDFHCGKRDTIHWSIDGERYRTQQDAFEALQAAGFNDTEASEYICSLETREETERTGFPRRLTERERLEYGRWRGRMLDAGYSAPRL